MPINIPENWPKWPQDGIEYLGHCPVCGSKDRTVLHENLIDRWFHAPGRWTMQLCSDCGSGYIDPRPSRDTISLAYTNYETHRPTDSLQTSARLATRLRNGYLNTKYGYQMQPASRWGYLAMHLLPPPLRLEWDHYARHLPRPKPGHNKLLDAGCGNGEFLVRARWQGWDVQGIDLDESALIHAREAGLPVTQGAIELGKFAPDSFDAITSHQVIEHMHSPLTFLHALYTWLKPGGRIWLGTPNAASALHQEFGPDWYDLHPPQHLVIFSPHSLLTAMSEAGFLSAHLLPRGYLDSHLQRQSLRMREMTHLGDWDLLHGSHTRAPSPTQQMKLETRAWLRPEQCSDLVAVAWKPAS